MQIDTSSTPTIVFLMVDVTDKYTAETGLTPTIQISKNGGAFAAATNSPAEIANGWYSIALTATETNTEGPLIIRATDAAAAEWRALHEIRNELAEASAVTTVDTVVDGIKAVTDLLPDSGALSSLATASALATVDTVVDTINTNVSALNDPTAAAIADAVCDEALSGHTTAGTLGKTLSDASTLTAANVWDYVVESQGSYTAQQALSIGLAVLAGVTGNSGLDFKTPDGVSTRVAATLSGSNRTSMTLTPSS